MHLQNIYKCTVHTDSNAGNNVQQCPVYRCAHQNILLHDVLHLTEEKKGTKELIYISKNTAVVMWAALSSRGSDRGKGELCS